MAKPTGSRNAGAAMRLLVLGLLKRHGPNHGHAMRQFIRNAQVDQWADVQPGSLYYALDQLAKEGLIVPERTEQIGQRPPRTIYRITAEGEAEIEHLLVSLIETVRPPNDPLNLALLFSGALPDARLADLFRARIASLRQQLEDIRRGGEVSHAKGFITRRGAEIFRHLVSHMEADLAWHEAFLRHLLAGELDATPAEPNPEMNRFFAPAGKPVVEEALE